MAIYLGDVQSTKATANGSIFGGPARVRGVYYVGTSGAGSITLKNGGSSGTSTIVIDTPASGYGTIPVPGDGVLFTTNVYANLVNITSLTVFYA